MRLTLWFAARVLLVVASGACAEHNPLAMDSLPPGAELLATRSVLGAQYSGIPAPQRVVLRDAAAWQAFWSEAVGNVTPSPPAPTVDFAQEMVVATALGQRPTGGYDISIDAVYLAGGQLFVLVREIDPPPGAVVTYVVTAPVAAVAVPRSDAPVTFTPASRANP